MNHLRRKLTYSNVISTLCLFLLVGGGTAFAANQLKPNSVGSRQLKKNAVTAAKVKAGAVTGAKLTDGAVTGAKLANGAVGGGAIAPGAVDGSKLAVGAVGGSSIAPGAVTGDKLAAGAVTGDKVSVGTLPTVPNSATTDVVKGTHGTLEVGGEAPIFHYGPFTLVAQCAEYTPGHIGEQILIASSTPGSAFASPESGSSDLGPETPEEDRIVGVFDTVDSNGAYNYENPSEISLSATSVGGQAFNAFIGEAAEGKSDTCWYWLTANIIG